MSGYLDEFQKLIEKVEARCKSDEAIELNQYAVERNLPFWFRQAKLGTDLFEMMLNHQHPQRGEKVYWMIAGKRYSFDRSKEIMDDLIDI